jgi:hypothetical protein
VVRQGRQHDDGGGKRSEPHIGPAESKNLSMRGHSMFENREISAVPAGRQAPVPEQGKWLRSVVQGHFNYYAVPSNKPSIDAFRTEVIKGWLHALRRRSQKSRSLTWERVMRLVMTWIPTRAKILHPYPSKRLRVNIPEAGAV